MLKKIYLSVFPNQYLLELSNALSECKSVLDLGCGASSPLKEIKKTFYSVGVDAFKKSIDASKKEKIHDRYYLMDVLGISKKFKPKSFDVVLASDLIEHLDKKSGERLLKMAERIARKKVVIFTPNGFIEQGEYGSNPFQKHESGWTPREFTEKGYAVIGINGWKPLRGDLAGIKYRPFILWRFISDLTQVITKRKPEYAFQIFCVKNIK